MKYEDIDRNGNCCHPSMTIRNNSLEYFSRCTWFNKKDMKALMCLSIDINPIFLLLIPNQIQLFS